MLKIFLYNLLLAVVLFTPLFFMGNGDGAIGWLVLIFAAAVLSLFVQLIIGIVFAAGTEKKELGKAMLLCVGIFLLIGLSVCGSLII